MSDESIWGYIPLPLGCFVLHAVTVHFFSRDFGKEQEMNKIKELRKEKSLTLTDLAKIFNEQNVLDKDGNQIKMSDSQLSTYENGSRSPRHDEILEALSDILEVPITYLLGYEDAVEKSAATISERIKTIRLNKGMTLEEFGELFSTSKGTVNNWEKGRNLPNKENLFKIAQLANMTVEELTRNSDLVSLTQFEFNRLKEIERKYKEIKRLVDG
ncbi:helix-turn-helix transcriptional regulator [Lactococcus sp. dk322]|nr:helix-turn-helix domain-containing protein [Lactococcus sp. dk101]TXK37127.1 helix-turn-helix transcriptional regulator [Lactococcus sp. dk310]TXK47982.1 helix-turn-helix transcriptional regulator [Lactococcus sp. dk322]